MGKKKKLFDQFPPVSTKDWMEKITADLKGGDFRKLIWKAGEGIEIMPFYREEDLDSLLSADSVPCEFPYRRGTKIGNNEWLIRQDVKVSDYHEANKKSLDILMKGINSLGFIISDPSTINSQNFEKLLNDLHPE